MNGVIGHFYSFFIPFSLVFKGAKTPSFISAWPHGLVGPPTLSRGINLNSDPCLTNTFPAVCAGLMPTPSFVMIADVAAGTRNSSATYLSTAGWRRTVERDWGGVRSKKGSVRQSRGLADWGQAQGPVERASLNHTRTTHGSPRNAPVNGASSGTETTRYGSFGSELRVIRNETLGLPLAAMRAMVKGVNCGRAWCLPVDVCACVASRGVRVTE